MSQIASRIRSLISQRKELQESVGVCDDYEVTNKAISLKAHLNAFTQEDKALLGNPKHPKLRFDECEQLIIPIHFAKHVGVAVVKLTIEEEGNRKAFVQYFDGTGSDLADDLLASLGAFFTESDYEVLYHCVSETVVQENTKNEITCIKAIELANRNVGIQEVIKISDETPAVLPAPVEKRFPWLLITLALGGALYMGLDYLQPYTAALMALVPANPLLAFIACAGVFYTGLLIVSCLQYLTREREAPMLRFRDKTVSEIPKEVASRKTFLKDFARSNDKIELHKGDKNKEAIALERSLRLN